MTPESIFLAALLLAALVLFVTGWLRVDVTAMLVLLALMAPVWPDPAGGTRGILTAGQAFSGFGSPAVLMLAGMFVLSSALVETGAAGMLGDGMLVRSSSSLLLLQATVFVSVAALSTLVSNTTTVLVAMPLVLSVCRRRGYPASALLMPIAFASLLGGQWTLIGTRSNILISDFAAQHLGQGISFFAFAPVAALIMLVSLAWFLLAGRHMLPDVQAEGTLAQRYEVTEFMSEVLATPGSALLGRTLTELDLETRHKITILQVVRGGEALPPSPWLRLAEADVLVVQGRMSGLTELLQHSGLEFKEELALGGRTLRSVDLMMVEAVVAPHSDIEGRTLVEADFPARYGTSVLAIGRRGHILTGPLSEQRLRFGDSLLLVTHQEQLHKLTESPDLVVANRRRRPARESRNAWIVLGLLAAVVVGSAAELLDPAFAIVAAAVLAVALRCISMHAVYEAIDWKTLVVVGGMIPFGIALEKTSTDQLIAGGIVSTLAGAGPQVIFAGLMLAVVALTQLIGNAAVAVLIGPLAYRLALSSGADPLPFLIGSAICTSASFMTPIAHEATLLVMGPGGYQGRDYLRWGTPFVLITWIVTSVTVPWFYPLV